MLNFFGSIIQIMNTQRQTHSFLASVSVHQNRKIITGIFKQQRLSSIFGFAHTVGYFCHFKFWIYIFLYSNQLIFFIKNGYKFLQVFVCHFTKIIEAFGKRLISGLAVNEEIAAIFILNNKA